MTIKITHGAAAVSTEYFFQPMETCPTAVKVLLLNPGNVAIFGVFNGRDTWPRGWAPLPKIPQSLKDKP